MLILLLILLILPLHASQLSSLEQQAKIDHEIRLAQNEVIKVETVLAQAQLDKRSDEDIKKCRVAVQQAAQAMLYKLTDFKEKEIRLEDIDFCLARNPDVNTIDDAGYSPLFYAVEMNITLVRELIRAGADVNHRSETGFWGEDTTLVHVAHEFSNYPTTMILLEAGAPLPFDDDPKHCAWFWTQENTGKCLIAHRQHLIDTINETDLIVPKTLVPTVVDYAFGRSPSSTKIDPRTGWAVYSDDEAAEGDEGDSDDEQGKVEAAKWLDL